MTIEETLLKQAVLCLAPPEALSSSKEKDHQQRAFCVVRKVLDGLNELQFTKPEEQRRQAYLVHAAKCLANQNSPTVSPTSPQEESKPYEPDLIDRGVIKTASFALVIAAKEFCKQGDENDLLTAGDLVQDIQRGVSTAKTTLEDKLKVTDHDRVNAVTQQMIEYVVKSFPV